MYVFFNLASNTIAKVVVVVGERAEILRASATQGKCAFGAKNTPEGVLCRRVSKILCSSVRSSCPVCPSVMFYLIIFWTKNTKLLGSPKRDQKKGHETFLEL